MKKLFKIILGATVGSTLLLSSCNFLDVDPYFEATFKEDSIFHSKKNAEGYLWNTPKGFPDAGAIWGNSWNPGESASDEITLKYQTNEFWGLQFSVGTINSRNLPIQNQWYDMYVIVARCNKMLKEVYNVPDMNEMDRRRYIGYVHFMRGYAYYHLLMNWGPLIIVGDEELSTSEPAEYYNRERATYDESVDYICDEFRLATQGIYSADEQSVNYYQRPTKGAAMALIARLRLFQASPLFNGGAAARKCFGTWKRKSDGAYYVNQEYDPRRWAVAAAAAKQLTKMGYELHTVEADAQNPYPLASNVPTANFPDGAGNIDPYHSYSDMFTGEGIIQTNKEFIWAMESSNVTNYTHHSFPVKFGGWGSMSVPQRVIDCYLMADGRTIHNSSAEYPYEPDFSRLTGESKKLGTYLLRENVPMMYANRSARFYASIGFPGRYWPMSSASTDASYVNQQWYQPDNAVCKGGFLVIEARKERNRQNPLYIPGSNDWRKEREFIEYTSSSVTTAGKKEFLYGRFEVRARIPVAKGAWPAIWTLGSNMEWPSCGEIDIMEYYQIKGVPHILANAAWGARTSNGGLNGIVRPHPISILRRKIRNGLPNFTFGGWIGMKKLSNSIWMMNC